VGRPGRRTGSWSRRARADRRSLAADSLRRGARPGLRTRGEHDRNPDEPTSPPASDLYRDFWTSAYQAIDD
jgi:hypothetical protein